MRIKHIPISISSLLQGIESLRSNIMKKQSPFVLLLLFAPILAWSQVTVIQSPTPQFRSFLPSGAPNASGCVYTFTTGTSTPQATYTDFTGNTPNTNPVILDGTGSANIWISSAVYRIQVWSFGSGSVGSNCGNGTQLYQVDGVKDTGLNAFGTGPVTIAAITNGIDIFTIIRATDVSPTGDFLNFKSFAGNSLFKVDITGDVIASQFNHQRTIDGSVYPNTGAGFQQAVTDCINDSLCSDVHAELLGSVSTSTTTSLTKPMRVWLGAGTNISGTADPVVCFSNSVQIQGVSGNIQVNTVASIISTVAGSRVLAPCATNPHVLYPVIRDVALINTTAGRTAKIVDLTNTNHARMDNVGVESFGGSADMIFVTIVAPPIDAFWNNFNGVKVQGTGTEVAYHFDGGANSQTIVGGFINNVANCYSISQGAGTVTNDIEVIGSTCEAQSGAAWVTTGLVQSVHGIGNRMEASGASSTLFNMSASSTGIEMIGTAEFGTQNCGTATGVSFIAWPQGGPCTPGTSGSSNSNTADIFTFRDISSNFFTGRAATASNTNTFIGSTLNDSAVFSTDALGSNFGVQIQDVHAGGHNFRIGEINCIGCLNFRDITQTGQPFWGFQATSTAAGVEGRFTHAITASRVWTMPDQAGTAVLQVAATSQKAETGAADTAVLSFTPNAVAATYRVCVSINVSSATAGVISWTLSWQDPNGNAQTNIAQPLFQFGTAAPNTTFTTSAVSGYTGCSMIDENSATAIVVKWVGGGTTAAKMSATIERLI